MLIQISELCCGFLKNLALILVLSRLYPYLAIVFLVCWNYNWLKERESEWEADRVCVCACVCVRACVHVCVYVRVFVCLYVYESTEREREREERQNDCTKWYVCQSIFSHHNFCTQRKPPYAWMNVRFMDLKKLNFRMVVLF